MAYQYGPPPGAYNGRQPSYASFPPGGAPGVGPPGMVMDAPPGMESQPPAGNLPNQFQPPPNMPNINFNAPVIRLGVDQSAGGRTAADRLTGGQGGGRAEGRGSNLEPLGNRNRTGLGAGPGGEGRNMNRDREAMRDSAMSLQPPTREEVARTIFIGGLSEGTPGDETIENLLRCAGKLRRWTRAKDADEKLCKFGFAEYEDVESLEAANEILPGLEVPLFSKGGALAKTDEGEIKKSRLLVVVDEQSKSYIDEWKGRRKEDDDARHFRIDGCKEDLRQSITALTNVGSAVANGLNGDAELDEAADTTMLDANGEKTNEGGAEFINIPVNLEDELSDIPADMRATVAEEIKAFRDRSNRRDIERLKREEELEQAERQRSMGGPRINRLASPPPSGAPTGPGSASNGIPVGPRDKTNIPGAPSGPKGFRGVQVPSDYVNGVSFVSANSRVVNPEDQDAEESDDELERRRQAKRENDGESIYTEAERRLLNRERTRAAARQREKVRVEAEKRDQEREKDTMRKRLEEWDEAEEVRLGREEYYFDRSVWLRKRGAYRDRENRLDDADRAAEEREKMEEKRRAKGLADDFLDQTGAELEQKAAAAAADQPAGFKISLGSAAAKTKAAAAASQLAPRKTIADVENLLEDEEDAALTGLRGKPELKPLPDTSTVPLHGADLSADEIASARQALAADIPTATAELFAYPVRWNYLTPSILDNQIKPFVEKKVVEYLGVQEDLLVDTILEGLREHKDPKDLVELLEDALEDDAEGLVRKCWRLLVFVCESESRGLN